MNPEEIKILKSIEGKGKTFRELTEATKTSLPETVNLVKKLIGKGLIQSMEGKIFITKMGREELRKPRFKKKREKTVKVKETIKLVPVKEETRKETAEEKVKVRTLVPIEKISGKIKVATS